MQKTQKVTFLSADHLEEQAIARTREAAQMPPGEARQHALNNSAQLYSYAAMKRLLVPRQPGVGTRSKG
jgi:hypothetical protein